MSAITNQSVESSDDKNFGLIQMLKETKLSVYALLIVGVVLIFIGGFKFRRQWGSPEPDYLYGAYGVTPDAREEQERNED